MFENVIDSVPTFSISTHSPRRISDPTGPFRLSSFPGGLGFARYIRRIVLINFLLLKRPTSWVHSFHQISDESLVAYAGPAQCRPAFFCFATTVTVRLYSCQFTGLVIDIIV